MKILDFIKLDYLTFTIPLIKIKETDKATLFRFKVNNNSYDMWVASKLIKGVCPKPYYMMNYKDDYKEYILNKIIYEGENKIKLDFFIISLIKNKEEFDKNLKNYNINNKNNKFKNIINLFENEFKLEVQNIENDILYVLEKPFKIYSGVFNEIIEFKNLRFFLNSDKITYQENIFNYTESIKSSLIIKSLIFKYLDLNYDLDSLLIIKNKFENELVNSEYTDDTRLYSEYNKMKCAVSLISKIEKEL